MLSYSGIIVLFFANKVVKVQPQKFLRSLYGAPRTLQYVHIHKDSLSLLHAIHCSSWTTKMVLHEKKLSFVLNMAKTWVHIIRFCWQFFTKINFIYLSIYTAKNPLCVCQKTVPLGVTPRRTHNEKPFSETLLTHATHHLCFVPSILWFHWCFIVCK